MDKTEARKVIKRAMQRRGAAWELGTFTEGGRCVARVVLVRLEGTPAAARLGTREPVASAVLPRGGAARSFDWSPIAAAVEAWAASAPIDRVEPHHVDRAG